MTTPRHDTKTREFRSAAAAVPGVYCQFALDPTLPYRKIFLGLEFVTSVLNGYYSATANVILRKDGKELSQLAANICFDGNQVLKDSQFSLFTAVAIDLSGGAQATPPPGSAFISFALPLLANRIAANGVPIVSDANEIYYQLTGAQGSGGATITSWRAFLGVFSTNVPS